MNWQYDLVSDDHILFPVADSVGDKLCIFMFFSIIIILGRPYYHEAVAALRSMLPQGLLYKLI